MAPRNKPAWMTPASTPFLTQAWHWFDGSRALTESRRILKPLGGLGLLWNEYDRIVPWVNEYADIPGSLCQNQ